MFLNEVQEFLSHVDRYVSAVRWIEPNDVSLSVSFPFCWTYCVLQRC